MYLFVKKSYQIETTILTAVTTAMTTVAVGREFVAATDDFSGFTAFLCVSFSHSFIFIIWMDLNKMKMNGKKQLLFGHKNNCFLTYFYKLDFSFFFFVWLGRYWKSYLCLCLNHRNTSFSLFLFCSIFFSFNIIFLFYLFFKYLRFHLCSQGSDGDRVNSK